VARPTSTGRATQARSRSAEEILKQKPKTGRRASQDERDAARELVQLYRADNPEMGELVADNAPAKGIDDEVLIAALLHFAEHGTFRGVFDARHLLARRVAAQAGPRAMDKVRAVMDQLDVTERTAQRLLAK
jgi:hypothetical protein